MFELAIDADDIFGIIEALKTAFWVGVMCICIAAALVGCAEFDRWRDDRKLTKAVRVGKHFGGV